MKLQHIYCLGDYYKDDLKQLCRTLNTGTGEELFAKFIADYFINQLPKDAALIPVPNINSKFSIYTAKHLYELNKSFTLLYPFRYFGVSFYLTKKLYPHYPFNMSNVPIELNNNEFTMNDYIKDKPIILINNVIATGLTMQKCMHLLDRECSALCIAVDNETFNKYNNE